MLLKKIPTRFEVSKILDKNEKELILQLTETISLNEETPDIYKCLLRNSWRDLKIECGDFINILQPQIDNDNPNLLIVDNLQGFVILKPDVLLPITTLTSANYCMRKAWLRHMFDIFGEPSLALLVGTIVHEIFQETIKRKKFEVEQIKNLLSNELINKYTLDLYAGGWTHEDLIQEMQPYFHSISNWLKLYHSNNINSKREFKIENLYDIEETIWSNKYGCLGKIDLTLEVLFEDEDQSKSLNLIPLELKSGRNSYSAEHLAQVILYLYLMSEKYSNYKSLAGFLLYLKDEAKISRIKASGNAFRDLLILRNRFINYFHTVGIIDEKNEKEKLLKGPELISDSHKCKRCEHNLDCSLIYKCFDAKSRDIENHHFSNEFTSHLKETEMQFFSKMLSLLEVEKHFQAASEEFVTFWNYTSQDCEKAGIGLSKLKIIYQDEKKIILGRDSKSLLPEKLFTLNPDLKINPSSLENRRAMINEELINSTKTYELFGSYCKQLCKTIGYVKLFQKDQTEIVISLEKDQINFLNPTAIYRIDFLKNLTNKAIVINYSNLLRLMIPDDPRANELREIVIHGRIPKFNLNDCNIASYSQILNSPILEKLNSQQKRCVMGIIKTKCSLIFGSPGSGKTQTIVALIQLLYKLGFSVLVTAFTHTAVDNILLKLIKANFESNIGVNVNFIRMGNVNRINQKLFEYTDHYRTKEWLRKGDLNSLRNFYSTIPVAASTCLGVFNHPFFQKRTFDFCIIDEASQVFLTTSLGPLFNCKNFVLVGDQKQLPPVVQSLYARKNGLDESLFSSLLNKAGKQDLISYEDRIDSSDLNSQNFKCTKNNQIDLKTIRIFPLFIQYRMNKVIMEVANKLTYAGKLKCGNEKIESISLMDYLPSKGTINQLFEEYDGSYLAKVISPHLQDSVLFLDTDCIKQAVEIRSTEGCQSQLSNEFMKSLNDSEKDKSATIGFVYNDFEAQTILKIVQTLLLTYSNKNKELNFKVDNIGIISPFRKQVQRINELFGSQFLEDNHLEINTVDQYQGRDKDVIIYSCVKSAPQTSCQDYNEDYLNEYNFLESIPIADSELLKDQRRLNVAITRAKRKLIIIGNRNTLKGYLPFKNLFNVLEPEQFVQLIHFDYQEIIDLISSN